MDLNSKNIIDVLRRINYPGKDKDIISLNMVEDIKVDKNNIHFALVVEKNTDPLVNSIKRVCVRALRNEFGDHIEIEKNITIKAKKVYEERQILPNVKNIIAIASGKGGVGKSTVAVNLSVALAKSGFKTGLIDADVYGPSIPKMFNTESAKPLAKEVDGKTKIIPIEKYDVKLLSVGFFVNANDALVWRGPMATGALKQLISDGDWDELDYLVIDLPPGTGDIHLTMVQEVPVTGAVIVSTPQEIALTDAIKGISMFQGKAINVPILGLVENMAWFTPKELPDNKYFIFGKEGCKKLAQDRNLPFLGQIPIVQGIRESGDKGIPVVLEDAKVSEAFMEICKNLVQQVDLRIKNLEPTKRVEINKK
ncbi:P-loop NTPase [Bacteroidota bacterium]